MDELTQRHCEQTLADLDILDKASLQIAAQRLLAFAEDDDIELTPAQREKLENIVPVSTR